MALATMQHGSLDLLDLLDYGMSVRGGSRVETTDEAGALAGTDSFHEVGLEALRLATAMAGLGVGPDDVVGSLCWNTREHLAAYLGIPAMGGVLHTINIRLHGDDLAYVVTHAGDRVLLVDEDRLEPLAAVADQLTTVEHVVVVGSGELPARLGRAHVHRYDELVPASEPCTPMRRHRDEASAALVCYTSGTTGRPKGVVYSHRSVYLHALTISTGSVYGLNEDDRILPIVPMFHANAWGLPHAAWLMGSDLVLPGRWLQAERLARLVTERRPTAAFAVPTIWTELARVSAESNDLDFTSLRLAVAGGSALPPAVVRAMAGHGVVLTQGWGLTETSPLVSYGRVPPGAPEAAAESIAGRAGRVVPLVTIRATDERGGELPRGEEHVGELELRGPTIAGGYSGVPDDDQKFRDGWFRTGDLGSVSADGWVRIRDRLKDGIKTGGEWISTPALEAALLDHPSITGALVFGVEDLKWGERPLACITLRDGGSQPPADLAAFLDQRVARYWIPERWVVVDHLPTTTVGKLDKARMRRLYAEGDLRVLHGRPGEHPLEEGN